MSSAGPAPAPASAPTRRLPQLDRVASNNSGLSFGSSADGRASPASTGAIRRTGSNRSVGSGMIPPLVRHQSTRRRLVSKKAIQEREDFGILLFAAFWLCFNAGMVNVITISSYLALTTTHVTGLVAKTSIALADEDWHYLYLPATVFLCFLLGATIGGVIVRYDTFYLGRTYGRSLILIALLIGLALLSDKLHAPNVTNAHYYLYMCAIAGGLQNSLTSKYSGNTIRTTHLTGATTDLGIALGHLIRGRWEELWKVQLHSTSIAGFLLGGVVGRFGYKRYRETALAFNVTILFVLGLLHTLYLSFHEHLPVWAVIGTKKDIKVHHSSHHGIGSHGSHHGRPASGGGPFGRAQSTFPFTSGSGGGTRVVRSALALERIDSSGVAGAHPPDASPFSTSLSQGQLPLFLRGRSWLSRGPATGTNAPAAADTEATSNGASASATSPSPVPPHASQAAAKATAMATAMAATGAAPERQQSLPRMGSGAYMEPHLIGRVGSPRSRPLTEQDTHRLIQVEVVEEVEEVDDDDLTNPGDVDEYSVGDVAGEATDDEFEFIVDEVGELVEFIPENTLGEEGGQGATSPTFYEAVEVAQGAGDGADAAAVSAVAAAGGQGAESDEQTRTPAESAI